MKYKYTEPINVECNNAFFRTMNIGAKIKTVGK